ncbi:MAG: type II secretion system F family protein [Demequinaceae bacterium]|nr:type II secretion system F family protein [Demequinaceae bacterium]
MTRWAVFLGLTLGLGLTLVIGWWRSRTPTLIGRVAPRLRSVGDPRGLREGERPAVGGVLGGMVSLLIKDSVRLAERWGSSTADLAIRLRRAGSPLSVTQFRAEQVMWAMTGVVVGLVLAGGMAAQGASPMPLVAMVACAGIAGGVIRDWFLTRAIRGREERIHAELPTVADLLALAVSAGEGALGAIERVVRTASGVLVEELRWTLGEVRTGTSLADSLHALADRTGVAALSRFATGVGIAVERGTPLADVLHSQALDVREAGRRRLIEEGGKREIAMMVPVVFLLLPVTVVFAIFPGIVAIHL